MSATPPSSPDGKGLATGQLGLIGSTVIGLASTAPVYSLAATLGFVVIAVGAQAPIAMLLAFLPMFFVAFAYRELNRAVPDCGTTFTWATKAFGPRVGWMGGWGVAVAGIIVLANLAQIGGRYFWLLLGQQELADSVLVVTLTGVAFIALMVYVSYRGLEIGERLQNVLLGVQYLSLVLFVVFVAVAIANGSAPEGSTAPSVDWFNPFAFDSFEGFTQAILLCLFIYWGWDT
jgi:amino acid transporter